MSGAVVVIGVAGSGKSTLGRALASALRWRFVEGDELHPPENIAKMRAGIPLEDADREPFLRAVAAAVNAGRDSGVVATCSALKRAYRAFICSHVGEVRYVMAEVDRDTLTKRLSGRENHFMPASLLDSQLAQFEPPDPDEGVIVVDGSAPLDVQVATVLNALGRLGAATDLAQ